MLACGQTYLPVVFLEHTAEDGRWLDGAEAWPPPAAAPPDAAWSDADTLRMLRAKRERYGHGRGPCGPPRYVRTYTFAA